MRIMIVDDNKAMRSVIKETVSNEQDEIFEYENGLQAVAAFGRVHPDWVLMDLLMDEMDGLTAARRIRESFPDAQIIIVTNYDCIPYRTEAYNLGVKAYVLKEHLELLPSLLITSPDVHNGSGITSAVRYSASH